MKKLLIALMAAASLAGCQRAPSPIVPDDWRLAPGGAHGDEESLGAHVDQLLGSQARALSELPEPDAKAAVPWHLEYMITELAIGPSGTLGTLIMKGTPSVTAMWRRQYERRSSAAPAEERVDALLTGDAGAHDLERQLEPAILAALRSGKVKNERALRENLARAAEDFLSLTRGLAATPAGDWWVSRFRVDLTADVSGNVSPVVTAGGEVRFRLEWHRMMKLAAAKAAVSSNPDLDRFVRGMIEDLREITVASQEMSGAGFQPYSFRVGVGFTAKGEIAIGKASGTITGQVYFSANVKKPPVKPSPTPRFEPGSAPSDNTFTLLDEARGKPVALSIDRGKFRDGLRKATGIGAFFARRAARAGTSRWKVYELRTGLDLSVTGKVGLAEVGGVATAQVSFYNQDF